MFAMRSLVLGALLATTVGARADVPKGYVVVPGAVSPDGKWQVIIPSLPGGDKELPPCETRLVAVATGGLVAKVPGECFFEHAGQIQFLSTWSKDSRTLVWEVDNKWGSANVQILELDARGKVTSAIDARRPAEDRILAAVRAASPKQAATAKEHGKGNGSWYRDGFAIDVQPRITGGVAWPIAFTIDITSDTKCMWPKADLAGGTMTATLDAAHRWTFGAFVAGHKQCSRDGTCTFTDCE